MVKKIINNEKGSTLVLVLVLIAAISIFATSYSESAYYNFKSIININNADTTIVAGEATSEKWFSFIRKKVDPTNPDSKYIGLEFPLEYGQENQYMLKILEKIKKDPAFKDNIQIKGDGLSSFDVKFGRFEVYDAVRAIVNSKNVVSATVGIVSLSTKQNGDGGIIVGTKRLYYSKKIDIPYTLPMSVDGAFSSVGDIVVSGEGTANITGNISAFGTFPKILKTPNQYYFGGVMVKNNAKLNVKGNIYSRSFVRTGEYVSRIPKDAADTPEIAGSATDSAEINVTKDVIAQDIHTFSRGNKIYIYRNAYTLDDLEINSDKSIIAINGSYIGLSKGSALSTNHDESSSILNSATLHAKLLSEPTTSRIVINGDVIVPGSAFKISTDGTGLYAIESAGLIYPDNGSSLVPYIPAYKYDSEIQVNNTGNPNTDYQLFLNNSDKKGSYVNLFHVWTPALFPSILRIDDANIDNWKKNISRLILDSASTFSNSFGSAGSSQPPSITGIGDLLGANDSMYFNPMIFNPEQVLLTSGGNKLDPSAPWKRRLKKLSTLEDAFVLDGFLPSEISKVYKYEGGEVKLIEDTSKDPAIEEKDPSQLFGTGKIKELVAGFWNKYWKPYNFESWNDYYQFVKNNGSFDVDLNFEISATFDVVANLKPDDVATEGDIDPYAQTMINSTGGGSAKDPANYNSKLNELKTLIENRLNKFSIRTFPVVITPIPTSAPPSEWVYEKDIQIEEVIKKIGMLYDASLPAQQSFFKIYHKIAGNTVYTDTISPSTADYYIYCNEDPKLDLIVAGNFNGIIITKGRVILRNGANIKGTILATGRNRGDSNLSTIDNDSMNILDVSEAFGGPDVTALDNGDCAGIKIELGGVGQTVNVDYFLGKEPSNSNDTDGTDYSELDGIYSEQKARELLINKFRTQSIELSQIF